MFNKKGFTLIELIIVIAILGILAAVAIPRYFNLVNQARDAALRGALGSVRSAISITHASAIAGDTTAQGLTNGPPDYWPTLAAVDDNATNNGSDIMENGDLPDNPYSTATEGAGNVGRDAVVAGTKLTSAPTTNTGAWIYDTATGGFYANTNPGWDL